LRTPVSEEEAHELYETFAVPASGTPLFQAATANLNPWTEAKVDTKNPERGPLLLIAGEKDNTAPFAITNASYKKQKQNDGVTEISEMANGATAWLSTAAGGRSLDKALAFSPGDSCSRSARELVATTSREAPAPRKGGRFRFGPKGPWWASLSRKQSSLGQRTGMPPESGFGVWLHLNYPEVVALVSEQ